MTLRALTLIQPWAWAIAHAGKDVENRGWPAPPDLIGKHLAIHAGRKLDEDACDDIAEEFGLTLPAAFAHVAIVAVALVREVRRIEGLFIPDGHSRWTSPGPGYAWQLGDVVAFAPVPCRGKQGLWPVPPDELEIVRQRWKAARAA